MTLQPSLYVMKPEEEKYERQKIWLYSLKVPLKVRELVSEGSLFPFLC